MLKIISKKEYADLKSIERKLYEYTNKQVCSKDEQMERELRYIAEHLKEIYITYKHNMLVEIPRVELSRIILTIDYLSQRLNKVNKNRR
jgi:hypothetical protein